MGLRRGVRGPDGLQHLIRGGRESKGVMERAKLQLTRRNGDWGYYWGKKKVPDELFGTAGTEGERVRTQGKKGRKGDFFSWGGETGNVRSQSSGRMGFRFCSYV